MPPPARCALSRSAAEREPFVRRYFMGAICGLMMTSMFCMLFPGPFMQKIVAGMGAVLFAALIIRDTQMIFGEVTVGLIIAHS